MKPTLDDSDVVVADIVITDEAYGADQTGVKDCTTTVQRPPPSPLRGKLMHPDLRWIFDGVLPAAIGIALPCNQPEIPYPAAPYSRLMASAA